VFLSLGLLHLISGVGGIDEESLLLDMQETCTDVHTWYAQISDIAMQFQPNVLQGQKANSYFSSTSLMPIDFRTKFKVDTYQFGNVNF
jgi:hypothetical protein